MPFDQDQVFQPTLWRPLTHPLFDVMPPGHPDEDEPATPEEIEWYRLLRHTTARAVQHIAREVYDNYTNRQAVAFSGAQLHRLRAYCIIVSSVFLDDKPSSHRVGDELNRLVKTIELVFHDPTPGPKLNWPRVLTVPSIDETIEIVDDAFWGRYPKVNIETQVRDGS